MRRRLTATLLVVVAIALGVAGVGSQLLVRRATLDDARHDVAIQATQIAAATEDLRRPATFAVLRQALRLSEASIVRFTPRGVPLTALPGGVNRKDLRLDDLAAGSTVSGSRGTLVYAAAPVPIDGTRAGAVTAVVFTRRLDSLNRGIGFFAVAALVSLALALVVAGRLARRIVEPIARAATTTRRMAEGDLSARVDLPDKADPEVASLASSIGTLATSLERSRATEREFLLSVSHDLRTPLTAIRGYGEALSDGAIDDNARVGAVITGESRRLERLVGDLLDLARLGAGSFTLEITEVALDDVLIATVDALQPAASAAGVTLIGPSPTNTRVRGDQDRLAQVVANLVENALSFATSEVRVTADAHGFTVTDDGPGIPAAERDAVFSRHYRSDTNRGRRLGTGLGLAIVAELVTAMRGTISVGTPSSGTAISVELPSAP